MGDAFRLRTRGGTAAEWLAAAERGVEAVGLQVLDRGEGWLGVIHPGADVEAARRWGGHLVIEAYADGLGLLFHLGTRRREVVARVAGELRAAGFTVESEGDDE